MTTKVYESDTPYLIFSKRGGFYVGGKTLKATIKRRDDLCYRFGNKENPEDLVIVYYKPVVVVA